MVSFKVGDFVRFNDGTISKALNTQDSYECLFINEEEPYEALFAVKDGHKISGHSYLLNEPPPFGKIYADLLAKDCGFWWVQNPGYKIKEVISNNNSEEDRGGLKYI